MILIPLLLGGVGLVCLLSKRDLIGVICGINLLFLSASLLFVVAGFASGMKLDSSVFALFVTLVGLAQLGLGYALSVRLYYLKKSIALDTLRNLKN